MKKFFFFKLAYANCKYNYETDFRGYVQCIHWIRMGKSRDLLESRKYYYIYLVVYPHNICVIYGLCTEDFEAMGREN